MSPPLRTAVLLRGILVATLLVLLFAWGGGRVMPRPTPGSMLLPGSGEQLLPMAVPSRPAPTLPPDEAQLESWLNIHSIDWSTPAGTTGCILFVRISLQHWARLALDHDRVTELVAEGAAPPPGSWLSLTYSAEDFLDDDDHDGDPLDPGELSTAPGGTEAMLICRNPAAQGS